MENQSLIHREASCLSRFDRLPVKSEMLKIIAVLAAVSVVEAFDLGLIGQTVLVLKQIWNLGPAETGLLATCSTIGVVLGTFSCGFLSDRYGRKRVLFWAVFIFTVFTFMGPLMENFYWVVAMRFLSGLGSGAVFPIPYLYISELVGAKQRGVTFAYCNSILVLSYVLPSSFGAWAVATFPLEVAWTSSTSTCRNLPAGSCATTVMTKPRPWWNVWKAVWAWSMTRTTWIPPS